MFSGASGFRPSPLKIAGSEIKRMDELSVAARMPTVVTESATRRSWAAEWCTLFLSFVSHPNYLPQARRPGVAPLPELGGRAPPTPGGGAGAFRRVGAHD